MGTEQERIPSKMDRKAIGPKDKGAVWMTLLRGKPSILTQGHSFRARRILLKLSGFI